MWTSLHGEGMRAAVSERFDAIVAAWGDGTVHDVASGYRFAVHAYSARLFVADRLFDPRVRTALPGEAPPAPIAITAMAD